MREKQLPSLAQLAAILDETLRELWAAYADAVNDERERVGIGRVTDEDLQGSCQVGLMYRSAIEASEAVFESINFPRDFRLETE